MKKLAALLLAAILMMTACGSKTTETMGENAAAESSSEENLERITVTDMTGREITLDEPAKRVVVLTAADCEVLYAIGAGDTIVGRGEYCNWPSEVMDIPAIASGRETNLEQILALKPDLLIMGSMDQPKEQVDALENAGVHVVVSDADDIEGTYTAIELLGDLMGKRETADKLVSDMKATFDEITANSTGDGSETIYFEVSPIQYGLWAAGKNTFMGEISDMLGVKNIFDDVDGWGSVSEEQVIERDPDYIVTISMYFGEGPTPIEEIVSRPAWENISAVKNNKIINLQNDELSRPGPRLADGAKLIYDFIYGE